MRRLRITSIVDNVQGSDGRLSVEHGLSLFIEYSGHKILFDTGQSDMFLRNAEILGIDLNDIECCVLSHGHYDHGKGFNHILSHDIDYKKLIVGKGFFDEKYSLNGDIFLEKGTGLTRDMIKGELVEVDESFQIVPGLTVHRNFERKSFETSDSKFHVMRDGRMISDDFSDEIVLEAETDRGTVLIVGCSHAGILNIASSLQRTPYAIAGGTHLSKRSDGYMRAVISALHDMGVARLCLSHCSGEAVLNIIREYDDIEAHTLHCGESVVFD